MFKKFFSLAISLIFTLLVFAGCEESNNNNNNNNNNNQNFDIVKSSLERDNDPATTTEQISQLVQGNTDFNFDLYTQVISEADGNIFYSPYSISIALAMTSAGAANDTLTQMEDAMNFYLGQSELHPAFNALDLDMQNLGTGDPDEFQLNIANAIWGQAGYNFEQDFLDTIGLNYGSGLNLLDFATDPEAARLTINDWVEDQTEDKIKDLLKEGTITPYTVLVLTNAIYFKADWKEVFPTDLTTSGTFNNLDGSQATVDMMNIEHTYPYYEGSNYQAVELPYKGDDVSMMVILPAAGEFDNVEQSLDASLVNTIVENETNSNMMLTMPKFSFEYELGLNEILIDMGMVDAFDANLADFSNINPQDSLYITDVVHKAFVAVDEKGTEAAAATAVVVGNTSVPAVSVNMNRPFIFLIRDKVSGTILFFGRVSQL
ncbi:MAG: serpin family protein [Myxococcota bacterium]